MSVDLPEPFDPRIPCTSPRSRRIDTSEIATTGFFFRPTTNRLLTPSMTRAGTPVRGSSSGRAVEPFFSSGLRVAVTM